MIAAFFDLDGTLITAHVWRALVRHHRQRKVKRLSVAAYLGVNLCLLFPLYRLRLVSRERFYLGWARDMAWLVRGMSLEEAEDVFHWVTEHELLPTLRRDVQEILRRHQEQGHQVVLVSGTFQPLLQIVARRLGVRECVGTPLEVRNHRYTGRVLEPLCLGPGKAFRLRQYIQERGSHIDLNASYAYSDSIWDLAFLEMVGHPVAVYPDRELLELARERGWPVIGQGGECFDESADQ